jgi:hypothetical protein
MKIEGFEAKLECLLSLSNQLNENKIEKKKMLAFVTLNNMFELLKKSYNFLSLVEMEDILFEINEYIELELAFLKFQCKISRLKTYHAKEKENPRNTIWRSYGEKINNKIDHIYYAIHSIVRKKSHPFDYCCSKNSILPQLSPAVSPNIWEVTKDSCSFDYCCSKSPILPPAGSPNIWESSFNYCCSKSPILPPAGTPNIWEVTKDSSFDYCCSKSRLGLVIPQGSYEE